MSLRPLAALALLLLLGCSCSEEVAPPAEPRGAPLPGRVVSLAPGLTDILYRIEADALIVGISDYCVLSEVYPAQRVGSLVEPDYDAIAALEPELVFTLHQPEVETELARRGIKFTVVPLDSFTQLIDAYRVMGHKLGLEVQARRRVAETLDQIEALKSKLGSTARKRVLFVLGPHPRLVAGPESIYHDMIRFARGENASSRPGTKLYPLDPGEVRREAPDVIVVALDRAGGARDQERREARFWRQFAGVPAVDAGRVLFVDESLFLRPGPLAMDGWQLLARTLHPKQFQ